MVPFTRRLVSHLAFFIIYLGVISFSSAQSYPDLFFTNVNERNGLSSDRIYKIIKDHDGFMWFATDNGLNRFDGYNMKVYKNIPGDSSSLLNNFVTTVFEDSENNLWVGTVDAVSVYDRERNAFIHFRHFDNDSATVSIGEMKCFFEDSKHRLWIASAGGGLNLFDRVKKIFRHYLPAPQNFKNASYQNQVRIGAITEDKDGFLWLASWGGLARFNPLNGLYEFFVYKPEDRVNWSFNNLVVSVLQDNKDPDIVWYGTWGSGLHRFNKKNKNIDIYIYNFDLPPNISNIVFGISVRDDSTLWVVSENGLGIFNKHTGQFSFYQHQPDNEHSLVSNTTNSIYADSNGLTWIGTSNGISIIDPNLQRFAFHEMKWGAPNSDYIFDSRRNRIYRKSIYSERNVWVYDLVTKKSDRFPIPHSDKMKSEPFGFFLDSKGIIWIGTTRTGIYQFNPATSTFTKLETEKFLHIPDSKLYINDFCEDKNGNLWMSSYGYGMIEYQPKQKAFTRLCDDMAAPHKTTNNDCIKIFSDSAGNIWGAFERFGLSKYDVKKDSVTSYNYTDNNYYGAFYGLRDAVIDARDRIWIASTINGLICFDEHRPAQKSVAVFNTTNNFPGNNLWGLVCDDNNNLWIGHNEGLTYFNTKTFESKNFSAADGLPANNIHATLYNPHNGEIWFPYKTGYYSFRPGDFKKDTVTPEIVINSFKLFDKEFSGNKNPASLSEIILRHNENFISFEFSALNFTNPSGVRYAYKLDGLDKNWIYSGSRRFASYTDLDPGHYTLHIRAANSDGVWNEKGKSIRITIDPAWWQTIWFGLILLMAAVIVAWSSVKVYTRRRLRKLESELNRQREIQNIRTRIARDIHDEIGAGLTKISMMSRNLTRTGESELQKKNAAEKISLASKNLIANLGEIVWTVNPAFDTLQNLFAYTRNYCGNFFENTSIQLLLDFPELKEITVDKNINPETKRNFILILKESLNNIVKHADAKNVLVTLKIEGNSLELKIRDDGTGFSMDTTTAFGNGLKNMKKRAEEIQASYEIISEKSIGTTSVLKVSVV